LRAERKAGKISEGLEKAPGIRTDLHTLSPSTTKSQKLAEAGISRDQASKWEQLANVPEAEFEAALAGPNKPSTAGVLRRNGEASPMDADALWLWGRLRDFEPVRKHRSPKA
jgi:hypothetical protein